jgi:uncharacterized protein YegP (UPF0339 family)
MSHPRFKISKGSSDEYSFNLTAANAERTLSSERYTTRASAEAGFAVVRNNAPSTSGWSRSFPTRNTRPPGRARPGHLRRGQPPYRGGSACVGTFA